MAKAIRITPEQYLALLELGATLYAADRQCPPDRALRRLLNNADDQYTVSMRESWAQSEMGIETHTIDGWSFWTLVDSE